MARSAAQRSLRDLRRTQIVAAARALVAARDILGGRVSDLLTKKGGPITLLPSDDMSSWPEPLRRKMAPSRTERHASA